MQKPPLRWPAAPFARFLAVRTVAMLGASAIALALSSAACGSTGGATTGLAPAQPGATTGAGSASATDADVDSTDVRQATGAPWVAPAAWADIPRPVTGYLILDRQRTAPPEFEADLRRALAAYGELTAPPFPDGSGDWSLAVADIPPEWLGSFVQEALDLRRAAPHAFAVSEVWYRLNYDCLAVSARVTYTIRGSVSPGALLLVDVGTGYVPYDSGPRGNFEIDVPVVEGVPLILVRAVLAGAEAYGYVDVREPGAGLRIVEQATFERLSAERDAAARAARTPRDGASGESGPGVTSHDDDTTDGVDDETHNGTGDTDNDDGHRAPIPPKVLTRAPLIEVNLLFDGLRKDNPVMPTLRAALLAALETSGASYAEWFRASGSAYNFKAYTYDLLDIARLRTAVAALHDARVLSAVALDQSLAVRLQQLSVTGDVAVTLRGTVSPGTELSIRFGRGEVVAVAVARDGAYEVALTAAQASQADHGRYVLARAARRARISYLVFDLQTGTAHDATRADWLAGRWSGADPRSAGGPYGDENGG